VRPRRILLRTGLAGTVVGVIDLHTHVLAGIDDGPADMGGSIELARAAREAGTDVLVATPHVTWDYPENTAAEIARRVEETNAALRTAGVGVEVRTGAEVAMTRAADLPDEELAGLRLGGGPWLLVECPLTPAATGFETLLHHLQGRGHRVVLGHPERCPALQRDPDGLGRLVHAGMLSSITAGALTGAFGRTVRAFALDLLERGLVHNVTSDAHDTRRRPPGVRAALEAAEQDLPGLLDQADWLTRDVPAAVLAGEEIPVRPAGPPSRRRSGLFRRASRRR
jgi:protein-tyrosine phosphatase